MDFDQFCARPEMDVLFLARLAEARSRSSAVVETVAQIPTESVSQPHPRRRGRKRVFAQFAQFAQFERVVFV